jgi:protein gp37
MSDRSKIEWTEATWNPLVGCTKVSPGCDNCYAKGVVNRFAGTSRAFPHRFDVVTIRDDRMLTQPLRWRRPRRIFVNSLSDLFHADVPDEFIAQVFAVMALAPQHTFQLLTKRHGRMRSLLTSRAFADLFHRAICDAADWDVRQAAAAIDGALALIGETALAPLPNVWLGVSVEDQHWAGIRIPALADTPAAVRWISAEPLLGPIDLTTGLLHALLRHGLVWIVVGGESGPGARPMHPGWARDLRDQCAQADVPFLFKQWGEWRHCREAQEVEVERAMRADGTYHQWEKHPVYDVDLAGSAELDRVPLPGVSAPMQRVGKKAAGRELDGHTHDGYPIGHHQTVTMLRSSIGEQNTGQEAT